MKLIIAGGRDFDDYDTLCSTIWIWYDTGEITEIVSGGARGADSLGERYAKENDIPLKVFPADWDTHGKKAGHIRNSEMANYGDELLAFWDGESKGTANMINQMKRLKKPWDVKYYASN